MEDPSRVCRLNAIDDLDSRHAYLVAYTDDRWQALRLPPGEGHLLQAGFRAALAHAGGNTALAMEILNIACHPDD